MSAVDEFNDFQSSPTAWLVNKLTGREGREADALREVIREEVLSMATMLLLYYVVIAWLDDGRHY